MKMLNVETKHLITNGIPTSETIEGLRKDGYMVLRTVPLNVVNEEYFGFDTDCITFYAKVDIRNVGSNYE